MASEALSGYALLRPERKITSAFGWHAVTTRSVGSACLPPHGHADPRLRRVTACHPDNMTSGSCFSFGPYCRQFVTRHRNERLPLANRRCGDPVAGAGRGRITVAGCPSEPAPTKPLGLSGSTGVGAGRIAPPSGGEIPGLCPDVLYAQRVGTSDRLLGGCL